MKTNPIDYLVSSVVMIFLVSQDLLLMAYVIVPVSYRWFGDYHVLVDGLMFLLIYGLLSALLYRVILKLHPMRTGVYSMEKASFTYWKMLTVVREFGRGALLPFTTVFARPVVEKLFGAAVGRDIAIGGDLMDPFLITIGDEAVLGHNSLVSGHVILGNRILIREIRIGARATIGAFSILAPGVEIGEGAVVTTASFVAPMTKIPPGEEWGGNPAQKIRDIPERQLRR